jgi:hypothetical protein
MSNPTPDYVAALESRIILAEMALADEVAGSDRASVKAHYLNQIAEAKWQLAGIAPDHVLIRPPSARDAAAPADPADEIRRDLRRAMSIFENPETPLHIRKVAAAAMVQSQAELARLTGTAPPELTEQDVQAHYAVEAPRQREAAAQAPPMSHMQNHEARFQRRMLPQEVELVSDPIDEAIRARRARGAAMAAQPTIAAHYGKSADALIPTISASPTGDLHGCSNTIPRTKQVHLSGRIAD